MVVGDVTIVVSEPRLQIPRHDVWELDAIQMKAKMPMQEMATEGETPPAPEQAMQESGGESHSPQQPVRRPPTVREAPAVVALRERRYDKLRKMGAEGSKEPQIPWKLRGGCNVRKGYST